MAYVGTPIDTRNTFQSLQGKRFDGDGSTTDFTLDVAPSSTLDIEVFVGNVRQDPNSAYTLSGTTLTFTGAPPSGTNNIYVVHQAKAVGTITPGANTVGVTELNLSDGSNGQFIKTDGSGTLSFDTVSGTTINNNADNRVITGSGTANTLEGESTLTFDGSDLSVGIATPTFTNGNGLHLNSVSDNLRLHLTNTATGTASGDGADIAVGSDGALNIINKENAVTRLYTNNTTRMTIDASGNFLFNCTSAPNGSVHGISIEADNELLISTDSTSADTIVRFFNDNGQVGKIETNGSSTSYDTTSDYRLKENINYDFDATTRVKQLKPARFNFIADADTTLDGFIAHEVTTIVPEAISGEKDAVDSEGNIDPQGIDQSKLVPLLTKALQEAITKIETLEARVTTLEE